MKISSSVKRNEIELAVHACITVVQQSPSKRRAMFGAVAMAAVAVVSRKKSSNASATAAESAADQRQPSALLVDRPMTAGLGT